MLGRQGANRQWKFASPPDPPFRYWQAGCGHGVSRRGGWPSDWRIRRAVRAGRRLGVVAREPTLFAATLGVAEHPVWGRFGSASEACGASQTGRGRRGSNSVEAQGAHRFIGKMTGKCRFEDHSTARPPDVREHARQLAAGTWEPSNLTVGEPPSTD